MKLIRSILEMQAESDRLRREGNKIGVVPTMGYLHDGHASLIRKAKQLTDVVITTLFVNPTQFGPGEDFQRYPRDFERDKTIASSAGADIIFNPEVSEMYPAHYKTYIEVEKVSKILEGKFRPTHFRGVTTIVSKLFLATKPHVAVFGQKDAQQAFIIRQMARDLNFDVEIVVAPIVREHDGLAMSSRNVYLKPAQRSKVSALYESLRYAEIRVNEGERSVEKLRKEMTKIIRRSNPTRIDYIAFVEQNSFSEVKIIKPPGVLIALAVKFGSTRLLDNISVTIS